VAVKACAVAPALAIDGGGVDDEHLPWVEALVLLGGDVDPIEETCQAVRKPDTFALIAKAVAARPWDAALAPAMKIVLRSSWISRSSSSEKPGQSWAGLSSCLFRRTGTGVNVIWVDSRKNTHAQSRR